MICTNCGEGFRGEAVFGRHQSLTKKGDLSCRKPQSLNLVQDANGFWGQTEVQGRQPRK